MYDNKYRRAKHTDAKEDSSGIFGLALKQTAAAIVCFAVVLGMKNSHNAKLKNYAESLGRALRHDANWEETVKETISKIKEYALPEENEQNIPSEQDNGISFQ